MNFLPGTEKIAEECVELFSLANTRFISAGAQSSLVRYQYVFNDLSMRGDQLIIEKTLAIAIKIRFLDDQSHLLKGLDRKSPHIGHLRIEGIEQPNIDIRTALNKLIHHISIGVEIKPTSVTILQVAAPTTLPDLQIPPGHYEGLTVVIKTTGEQRQKPWEFEVDLFELINEILRVLYLAP